MKLPLEYENKMKLLLSDLSEHEFERYMRSLEADRFYGLRVNTLKVPLNTFRDISPFPLEPVPWAENGFYYKDGYPGRHPFYHAGLYYIQEPSAMYPGACLRPNPGEKVLDICAAPGGKTTQLASYMQGQGILVSNDISGERVKALVKNVEMAGIRNCIITNESPENLSRNFADYFDKILVDAPCSGEGMFRKDEAAVSSWENYKSDRCREMQDAILEEVHRMLKPGGMLLYSTCTFSPLENEQTIAAFMERHPEYHLLDLPKSAGIADGVPKWGNHAENLAKTARLWPQRIKGEGHFTALLQKAQGSAEHSSGGNRSFQPLSAPPEALRDFYRKNMACGPMDGFYCMMGNNLYYLPEPPPSVDGLKIARLGLFIGSLKGKIFKPSHPFLMAQPKDAFQRYLHLSTEEPDLRKYLRGDTLVQDTGLQDGLTAVCVNAFPIGWGNSAGGIVKNMYPKGWRRMD